MKAKIKSKYAILTKVSACLTLSAICSLCTGVLLASVPTNAIVDMHFSEGTGTTTVNDGTLGGSATFYDVQASGFPLFTNNVPVGNYVPSGNTFSVDFGPNSGNSTAGTGGRGVDLTTASGPLGTLGELPQVTVCGWLNARTIQAGNGGNRIAFALEGPGGNGFDLVQRGSGGLSMCINEYFDTSPESSPLKVTPDANMGSNNWVYFAVTYDPNLPSGQMKYYFGSAKKLASLDVARTYVPANATNIFVQYTGPLTVGNFSGVEGARDATGGTGSRVFRGLIDELRVYTNALTLDEIQQAQLNAAVPATPPTILQQPISVGAQEGQSATFTVEATGSGLLTYQWRTNGTAVAGATNTSFTLSNVQLSENGKSVSVYVDNAAISDPGLLSSVATLTVLPNNPNIVSASLQEGSEIADVSTNAGAYQGYFQITRNGGFPAYSNNVPTGPFAPSAAHNRYSIYMGTEVSAANRALDLTNNLVSSGGALGNMDALTICGWMNSGNTTFRTTSTGRGNAILNASGASTSPGFVLMIKTNGSALTDGTAYLQLHVNENNNTVIPTVNTSSLDKIPANTNGAATNWVFFAVTYDGLATTQNLKFYFGNPNTQATLDVIKDYAKGVIAATSQLTIGNHNRFTSFTSRSASGPNSSTFRGFLDEIKIYNKVLTLSEIQQAQVGGATPPYLLATPNAGNLDLSWDGAYQLQSRTNIDLGAWADVLTITNVSGSIRSLSVPMAAPEEFFRLR